MPTPLQLALMRIMPDRVLSMDVPGMAGELGDVPVPGGGYATTYGMSMTDPRLNAGRPTNIPMLAQGQTGLAELLSGGRPTEPQFETAISRALARQQGGEALPSFDTILQAINASKAFSAQEGRRGDYLRRYEEAR